MALTREQHEDLLLELLAPEIDHTRRTEILQEFRTNFAEVTEESAKQIESLEKMKADNDDLIVSNSKLFRQVGITTTDEKEEVDSKEFSETISIEMLEK